MKKEIKNECVVIKNVGIIFKVTLKTKTFLQLKFPSATWVHLYYIR